MKQWTKVKKINKSKKKKKNNNYNEKNKPTMETNMMKTKRSKNFIVDLNVSFLYLYDYMKSIIWSN